MRRLIFPICVALASCGGPPKIWVRADGQAIAGKLEQDKAIDQAVCEGEAQKAALSGTMTLQNETARRYGEGKVLEGCMAQKGYLHVTAAQ